MEISERRHRATRKKKRVSSYWNCHTPTDPRVVGMVARTPKPCSKPCCGNPRRHFGEKSIKEKIHETTVDTME